MATSLRIKICGVVTETDAVQAAELGADAIGLNFYPSSPRYVDPQVALSIVRHLPPYVEPVGVYVNQPVQQIWQHAERLGRLRTVQWHGDNPEVVEAFPFRFIPAFGVRDRQGLLRITRYLDTCRGLSRLPAAILVDAQVEGHYGGTGQEAPWDLLADFHPDVPVILAGGLTPENVAEAIRIVRPYGVDVASGVEQRPGCKDPEKMRRFIALARTAAGC